MRRFTLFSLALAALLLSAGCVVAVSEPVPVPQPVPPPLPPIGPTVAYFYDSLDPWGDWIWSDAWGWVWTPRRVSASWSPYREGQWIWTADGWYWLSDEPWGWATYHYGRWAWVHRWGWVWVPGNVWAPAWVAWRWGGGWAGWAPLPPEARWVDDRLYWEGDIDVWIDVDWWCFVQEVYIVEPRVYRYAVPVGRNVTLIRTAKDRTRYVKDRDRVVGRGFELDEVRRAIRKDVPVWRIAEVSSPRDAGKAVEARREVQVWRPRLDPPGKEARPEKPVSGRIGKEETERQTRRRAVPTSTPPTPPISKGEPPQPQPPVPTPPIDTPRRPERVARPRGTEPDVAAERERLAREQAAETERLERQQAEEARRVREEQERRARADREAAEARMRAEREEQARRDRERAAEARRAADEAERRAIESKGAEERRAREAALAKEQVERQRVEQERRVRAEAERKALDERQAEERRVQRDRADEERRVLEERARRQAERERPAKKEKEPEKKKEEPPPPERSSRR